MFQRRLTLTEKLVNCLQKKFSRSQQAKSLIDKITHFENAQKELNIFNLDIALTNMVISLMRDQSVDLDLRVELANVLCEVNGYNVPVLKETATDEANSRNVGIFVVEPDVVYLRLVSAELTGAKLQYFLLNELSVPESQGMQEFSVVPPRKSF